MPDVGLSETKFQVKGSSAEPYEVTFIKDGDSLTALCSCPAGQYGNYCKHRISILDGNSSAIVSDNADEVAMIRSWLQGTDVAVALSEYRALEKVAETPKNELVAAKRKLARAMNS